MFKPNRLAVSLNSRPESNQEEEEEYGSGVGAGHHGAEFQGFGG